MHGRGSPLLSVENVAWGDGAGRAGGVCRGSGCGAAYGEAGTASADGAAAG